MSRPEAEAPPEAKLFARTVHLYPPRKSSLARIAVEFCAICAFMTFLVVLWSLFSPR